MNLGLKNFPYWQYSGRALLQIGTMHDLDKNLLIVYVAVAFPKYSRQIARKSSWLLLKETLKKAKPVNNLSNSMKIHKCSIYSKKAPPQIPKTTKKNLSSSKNELNNHLPYLFICIQIKLNKLINESSLTTKDNINHWIEISIDIP